MDSNWLETRITEMLLAHNIPTEPQAIFEFASVLNGFSRASAEAAIASAKADGSNRPTVARIRSLCQKNENSGGRFNWNEIDPAIMLEYKRYAEGEIVYLRWGGYWHRCRIEEDFGVLFITRNDVHETDPRKFSMNLLDAIRRQVHIDKSRPDEYRPPFPWRNRAGKIVLMPRLWKQDREWLVGKGYDVAAWEAECEANNPPVGKFEEKFRQMIGGKHGNPQV